MKMMTLHRWALIIAGTLVVLIAVAFETKAQTTEGFIYGKVTTTNNSYTGALRWGTEEALWTDLFNAAKTENSFEKLVPQNEDEDKSWLDYDWSLESIWENKTIHQFTCQFGNLASIERKGRYFMLTFKNGSQLEVSGEGYNDLDSRVFVADEELGAIGIEWKNIVEIEFMSTPSKLETIFGAPLYGTVEGRRREKFTGFIVWDNDERLSTDKLDGRSSDGKVSLKFADIQSIERDGGGSRVVLKSGREFYLDDSNDVDQGNRGVLVVTEDLGIVKLSWNAFRSVSFTTVANSGASYNSFTKPKLLRGSVTTLDDEFPSGRIIFDIDEALDFELIEGKENDIEYTIPIKMIRSITPKNDEYASVKLSSGKELLIGDARDVSSENGGVLVFDKSGKKPSYIPWRKIVQISFEN